MLRPSRPFTVWLLWLAIVLLPMRAWAAAAMPVVVVPEAAAAMAADAVSPTVGDASSPCHQGSDEASVAGSPTCSLCGVCHSAVVSLPNLAPALPALASTRPPAAPVPGVERAVQGGPDRPPRSALA